MKFLYFNLNSKSFRERCAKWLVVADLLFFSAVFMRVTNEAYLRPIFEKIFSMQMPNVQLDLDEHMHPMIFLLKKTLVVLFTLVFLYHLVVYFYYQKGSPICDKYVRVYTFTNTIGLIFIFFGCLAAPLYTPLMILLAQTVYVYHAFAPKELKAIKTEEQ